MCLALNPQGQCFGTIDVAAQNLNLISSGLKLKQEGMKPPVFAKCSFPLTAEGLSVPSPLESKYLLAPLRIAALMA